MEIKKIEKIAERRKFLLLILRCIYYINKTFPSIRSVIIWVLIIIIVSSWVFIYERSNLLQKLLDWIILLNNLVNIYLNIFP